MIKISNMLPGIGPVGLDEVLRAVHADRTELNALELYAYAKRASEYLDMLMYNLRKEANVEFEKLASAPGTKSWRVLDFASVTRYSPQGSWEYPDEVVDLRRRADAAQDKSKKDGTAVFHPGEFAADAVHFKVKVEVV